MASLALSRHLIPFALFLLTLTIPATAQTYAQTYANLSRGTSLTPLGRATSWPSPSGDFAFGFRRLDSNASLFILAIWFNSTSPQTIVWFANGDTPVQAGSKLELTSDGQLSLTDQTGNEIWNPGVSNASYAALLDTGNLILSSPSFSSPLWQSFSLPADTLLPGQVLTPGLSLFSRFMDSNFSTGRFALAAQTDGNLVLYPVAPLPSRNFYDAYWATDTMGSGSNSRLVFSTSGDLYYALTNGTQINITSNGTYSTEDFYQRATLDVDGVFTVYVYPKKESEKAIWGDKWTAVDVIPSDICTRVLTDVGSGACGFNSFCVLDENKRPDCRCPSSYLFMDSAMKFKGCKPDFELQSCELDESDSFKLETVSGVDWPKADYEHYTQVDEENCRSFCLSDCLCAVAVYRNGECWKKKLPLSNGRTGNVGGKLLIKVPKYNASFPPPPGTVGAMERNDRSTLILVESLLLGSSGLLNLILITAIFAMVYCCHSRSLMKHNQDTTMLGLNLRIFTYKELEEATKGFSEELGSGSFGAVYKGLLLASDARTSIAVKQLHKTLHEDSEKEFTNEVRSIGQTHHKNLVRLFGFCNEGTHRILVYEYMCNGSLTSFLFGSERPSWIKRVQVATGIARGLAYLHDECSTQIIHCDIKPQNILLDENFVARISDFGLAKLLRTDQSRTSTGIRGTRGYVAPEWFRNTAITAKVDVYSFGVMLLEIICCRKNLEAEAGDEDRAVLVYWAYDCYREGNLELLAGNDEEAMADMGMFETLVMVAIWCIQEEPSLRPSMKKVNQMLEGAVMVSVPPDPSSHITPIR
ncbi:G-type lectin S-receptor-like serine/threonine-protein kinase LECRK3 [Phoenix dactylifera]|uniref:Receptor-like serine/threonine-protein kinase n=1 Tax=Phoenix dactylifera TaxID=42345 RepID=A0A8B7BPQ7_PHODC|nr:G-type lectin S-receptor-like serine/threonine-protein kinase LECRK3 [Phoenix dactylifera]